MQEAVSPYLSSWQNFYIIIGAAAATLTGLMFVVVTLMAGIETHVSTLNAAISAFNTPTIIHFCAVLLLAGILSAPWQTFSTVSLLLGLASIALMIYLINVLLRMRQVPGYQTPVKDWFWYLALPLFLYVALIIAGIFLPANPAMALYFISAIMLAILFLGIHNAWDLVTYLAVECSHPEW